MPLEFWVDAFLALALTIVLAWVLATIDIALVHRRAKRKSEQQRVIELLKRKQ